MRTFTVDQYIRMAEKFNQMPFYDKIKTIIENQMQMAGNHKHQIRFPNDIPSGSYNLTISSKKGRISIKIIK